MQKSISEFSSLIGSWSGHGEGTFTTIKPFGFREELKFRRRGAEDLIHYEQVTFLNDGTPSHWESGFLKINDGLLEISSAQDSGRVEVLRQQIHEPYHNGFRLELNCKVIQNDPRLIQTRRVFELRDEILRYWIYMSTQNISSITPHIQANLRRT